MSLAKYIKQRQNGTFHKEDILGFDHEEVRKIGDDVAIVRVNEPLAYFHGDRLHHDDAGRFFAIYDSIAYPFDVPFYPEDKEEGIKAQEMPERWEDALGLIESFGR